MTVEVSSVCDIGQKRKQNQDAILVYQDPSLFLSLFVVADGMGGYADGDRASNAIVSGLKDWVTQEDVRAHIGSLPAMLDAARDKLAEINKYILEVLNVGQICGSTCVALLILRDSYGVLSVGDSRIYRCRNLRCGPITRDDVWENQNSVRAQYSEQERRRHRDYGKLTHAVGNRPVLACSMQTDDLRSGDIFALCSDGIYKMCSSAFLKGSLVSCRWRGLDTVRDGILREVYKNGAKDNSSLILVRCT